MKFSFLLIAFFLSACSGGMKKDENPSVGAQRDPAQDSKLNLVWKTSERVYFFNQGKDVCSDAPAYAASFREFDPKALRATGPGDFLYLKALTEIKERGLAQELETACRAKNPTAVGKVMMQISDLISVGG